MRVYAIGVSSYVNLGLSMMLKKIKLFFIVSVLVVIDVEYCLAQVDSGLAASNFDFSLHAGGLTTSYQGSDFRDSMTQFSESLLVRYKKHYGFDIGGSVSRYYFKTDIDPVFISSTYSKAFASFNSETFRGRFGLRAGVINTQSFSRDETNAVTVNNLVTSNNVVVLSGVFYYRSHSGFSLDYGVISSRYFDVVDLSPIDVVQQNMTAGFSFNKSYDWLQYRSTAIDIEATEDKSYASHTFKYSHWFKSASDKSTFSLHLSAMTGERRYGVIEETSVVYNFSDVQQETYSLGLIWKPNSASVSLFVGKAFYEKPVSTDIYNTSYIYISIGNVW